MKEIEILTIVAVVLTIVLVILIWYVLFLRSNNKELADILEAAFENEQRLANKLDIAHQALKDANDDIQRHNQEGLMNGRVRLINTALAASKPEHLDF